MNKKITNEQQKNLEAFVSLATTSLTNFLETKTVGEITTKDFSDFFYTVFNNPLVDNEQRTVFATTTWNTILPIFNNGSQHSDVNLNNARGAFILVVSGTYSFNKKIEAETQPQVTLVSKEKTTTIDNHSSYPKEEYKYNKETSLKNINQIRQPQISSNNIKPQ